MKLLLGMGIHKRYFVVPFNDPSTDRMTIDADQGLLLS